ncbi:MAG: molybdopterin converting factor subunit 1 [Planctomycetota bacterium]
MTTRIKVLMFASLADRLGVREVALELPAGATAEDAVRDLAERYPALEPLRDTLAVAVNLDYVAAGRELADGDELALIPPVSGG